MTDKKDAVVVVTPDRRGHWYLQIDDPKVVRGTPRGYAFTRWGARHLAKKMLRKYQAGVSDPFVVTLDD